MVILRKKYVKCTLLSVLDKVIRLYFKTKPIISDVEELIKSSNSKNHHKVLDFNPLSNICYLKKNYSQVIEKSKNSKSRQHFEYQLLFQKGPISEKTKF